MLVAFVCIVIEAFVCIYVLSRGLFRQIFKMYSHLCTFSTKFSRTFLLFPQSIQTMKTEAKSKNIGNEHFEKKSLLKLLLQFIMFRKSILIMCTQLSFVNLFYFFNINLQLWQKTYFQQKGPLLYYFRSKCTYRNCQTLDSAQRTTYMYTIKI